jgi:hypothetical protein
MDNEHDQERDEQQPREQSPAFQETFERHPCLALPLDDVLVERIGDFSNDLD